MLQLKGIKKSYGKKENIFYALDDIELYIEKNETVAVVGKSGSGKSTLMHLLTGLDHPTSGTIEYEEKSIYKELDTDTWRGQNIGIVFQQFFLQQSDSVLENVCLPLKIQGVNAKKRKEMALKALEQVGLLDRAKSKANDLSGGQKQRVAIARAIVGEPSILIADEPTGNLDSENGDNVVDLLFDLNKRLGTTLIIVTHDEDLAKMCQRIIRLKDGKIIESTKTTKGGKK
jgi:putative ABC transport system ATP-binding protein